MQRKQRKISLCSFHDPHKVYKWAPFRLPLLPQIDQEPVTLIQALICENDVDPCIFYVLLLTCVKKEDFVLFITRVQICGDQELKVSQRMIGKFKPDRDTVNNGLQGLSSVCIGGFIYLFYNLGSKSNNCACVIDVSSIEKDQDAYNDASPHVFKISQEVPNKAISEGLVLDYSIHSAKSQNKILFFGGLNGDLKPLSSLLCFDLNIQEFVPYKSFNDDPRPRYGHTGAVVNQDQLIIFGGSCDQTQNLTIDYDPLDRQNSCELNILNIEGQQWGRVESKGVGTPSYLVEAKAVGFQRQKDVPRNEGQELKNWNIATLWHTRGLKSQEYKVSMLNLDTNRWICLNIEGLKLSLPHALSIPLITRDFCLVFDLSPLDLIRSESGKTWRQWTMWVLRQVQEVKQKVQKPNFAKLTTITSKFQKEIMNEEESSEESEDNLTFEELLAIEKKKIQEEELKKEKLKQKKKRKKLAKQQKLQEQKETKKV